MNEEKTENSDETPEETAPETSEETSEETPESPQDEAPQETAEASAGEDVAEDGVAADGAEETSGPQPSSEASAKPLPQHTYEELHGMTVVQLREVAEGIDADALHGYTTMHKEHLLPVLCGVLGIQAHEHHEVVGIDKGAVKQKIRALKEERDVAEAAADGAELKRVRRKIRGLKRKLRKSIV